MKHSECHCSACRALLDECGPDLIDFYRRKLLVRGWAGVMSGAERAYARAHRSEAATRQARASAVRLKKRHAEAAKPYRRTEELGSEGKSTARDPAA